MNRWRASPRLRLCLPRRAATLPSASNFPAQDGEDGAICGVDRRTLAPVEPAVRVGNVQRRRIDARAHPCDRRAHPQGNAAGPGRSPDLRRSDARCGRDRARLLGREVRHIVALRGDPCEADTRYQPHPGGYANAAELVEGLKRVRRSKSRLPAIPRCTRIRRAASRPRQSEAQDRRRRGPEGDPRSSFGRQLLPLPGRGGGRGHRRRDRSGHSARVERRPGGSPRPAARASAMAGPTVRGARRSALGAPADAATLAAERAASSMRAVSSTSTSTLNRARPAIRSATCWA